MASFAFVVGSDRYDRLAFNLIGAANDALDSLSGRWGGRCHTGKSSPHPFGSRMSTWTDTRRCIRGTTTGQGRESIIRPGGPSWPRGRLEGGPRRSEPGPRGGRPGPVGPDPRHCMYWPVGCRLVAAGRNQAREERAGELVLRKEYCHGPSPRLRCRP